MAAHGIEILTSDILKRYGIFNPPIDIKQVARLSGVKVKVSDLGEGVSGFLAIKNGKALIAVNPDESLVRQRFSIAHELGHFHLHSTNGDVLFVSKQKRHSLGQEEIHYRDEKSSSGEFKKERDANGFAAAILMPQSMLIKAIDIIPPFFSTEEAIKSLAKTFNVSSIAMSIRLTRLGLISQLENQM
jgi:Zn-dependent peptidase ImmA (M78 family)